MSLIVVMTEYTNFVLAVFSFSAADMRKFAITSASTLTEIRTESLVLVLRMAPYNFRSAL